jgi:hypothetical protein
MSLWVYGFMGLWVYGVGLRVKRAGVWISGFGFCDLWCSFPVKGSGVRFGVQHHIVKVKASRFWVYDPCFGV